MHSHGGLFVIVIASALSSVGFVVPASSGALDGPALALDDGFTADLPVDFPTGLLGPCGEHDLHPPIRITEDHGPQGFAWTNPATGEEHPRPGSGVLAGDGSEADPFVIEGWCIVTPPAFNDVTQSDPVPAIIVSGTEAHVVIEDVVLVGSGSGFEYGVHVLGSANVTVQQSHAIDVRGAFIVENAADAPSAIVANTAENGFIAVWNSTGIDVLDNQIEASAIGLDHVEDVLVQGNHILHTDIGLSATEGSQARIVDNVIEATTDIGVFLVGSQGFSVEGNHLSGAGLGIELIGTEGTVVSGNVLEGHGLGVVADAQAHDVTVDGNEIDLGGAGAGIGLAADASSVLGNTIVKGNVGISLSGTGGLVAENTVTGNEEGLVVEAGDSALSRNEVTQNGVGVTVTAQGAVTLTGNNIHANSDGIGLDASQAGTVVDARGNWWGCPNGPADVDCDDVLGEATVEPWLASPNPAAGAS